MLDFAPLPTRLTPQSDLRRALEDVLASQHCEAAFILSGVGSLSRASLRLAGAAASTAFEGDLEILTLAGTLAIHGAHLHMSVATAQGSVCGGHVGYGCIVRTTAEVLIGLLPDWSFTRELDAATGYAELTVRKRGARS